MNRLTYSALLLVLSLFVLSLKSQDLNYLNEVGRESGGTIKDIPDLNATSDAILLRRAMKGFGTDEKAVIDLITKRSNADRQKIAAVFRNLYGKELAYKITHEFSHHAREVLKDLLVPTVDYDAQVLKSSMMGAGTDLDSITSVLCSKSGPQLEEIKNAYQRIYKTRLEDDLRRDTSQPLLNLYLLLINGNREQSVDEDQVAQDVKAIAETNLKNLSPDNPLFKTLGTRSREHIIKVLEGLKSQNKGLKEVLDQDVSGVITVQGKTVRTVKNLLECYESPPKFYAQQIVNAVKGMGTNDKKMFRIIISRSEIDLDQIKEEFKKLTQKELADKVQNETTGTYRKVLLGLLQGNK